MAYENHPAPPLYDESLEQTDSHRLSLFYIPVAVFIIGAVSVSALAGWATAVKALGALLLAAFIFRYFQVRVRLGLEVFLYLAWVVWSLFAVIGPNVYASQFMTTWTTILQIWLLIVILSGYVDSRKAMLACLLAFLIGAVIVGGYSYLTGEYDVETNERVSGLAKNANAFGRTMIWGTLAVAFLWMTRPNLGYLKYIVFGLLMVFFAILTVLSGSRFSALGLVLLYVLWGWYCYRKTIFRRPAVLAAIVLIAIIGGYAFFTYASHSLVGRRLSDTWLQLSGQRSAGGDAGRVEIYLDSLKVAVENPILGVGLGNYIIHSSTGKYSHSDFTEVAADTGIPGFLIYFSIYVVLWRRCGRIIKNSDDPATIQTVRLIRASILVVLFLSLGTVNYMSKPIWIILACFIGYTNATWNSIQQRMLAYGPQEIETYPNNSPAEPYTRQPEQSPAVSAYDERLNTAQD